MGLFDDLIPAGARAIPNEGRALLSAIAGGESPSYNTMYGGGQFTDFADHPRQAIPITTGPNKGKTSSAAGLYQFLGSTWDEVKKEANLPDFSPESQDQGAWHLAQKVYKQKTGRELIGDLQLANGNPQAVNMIGRYLSGTWTSIPGGIEPNSQTGGFGQRYAAGLGAPAQASEFSGQAKPAAGLFDDLIPASRFADTLGENFRVAREGVSEPPKPFLERAMKAAGEVWENPPSGGLIANVIKPAYEGYKKFSGAASGEIPVRGPDGQINEDLIRASTDIAKTMPMGAAPGGIFAAPVGRGLPVAPAAVPKTTPTIQELKAAATAGYQSPEVKELAVKPTTVAGFAQTTKAALNESGFDDTVATGTFRILDKLEKAPEGAVVTGQNIHSLKKTLGNAAREVGPDGLPTPNAAAARQAQRALDDLVPNLAEKDVVAGSPAAASQALKTADANYAAAKTAESIDRTVIKAENRAKATNSGMNVANTVRQRLATVMNDPAQFSRFKPDEQEMIRQIVHGTPTANAVRFVAKLLGGGGGLGTVAVATAGGLATGGVGAGLPLVGIALNALANRMTTNQAAKLSQVIRDRAPLANAASDLERRAVEYSKAQTARNLAGMTLAARNLSNNLKDAGFALSPTDILRSLQGTITARPDQDQQ